MFLKVKTKWEIADGVDRQWAKSLLQDEGGRVVKQSPAKIVTVPVSYTHLTLPTKA